MNHGRRTCLRIIDARSLPDIDWVKIPEAGEEGDREFIYGEKGERRTEPTFWIVRYPVTYRQFQAFVDARRTASATRNGGKGWRGISTGHTSKRSSTGTILGRPSPGPRPWPSVAG
jgi:hypothetical protein